ncbi:hypothetical protein F4814DRAFT_446657 [Daldinia grandis]|nr:hypothetical protein F4814DRAFT_446657 [Daldinia grandis]
MPPTAENEATSNMERQNRDNKPKTHQWLYEMVYKDIMLLVQSGQLEAAAKIIDGSLHEHALEVARRHAGLPQLPSKYFSLDGPNLEQLAQHGDQVDIIRKNYMDSLQGGYPTDAINGESAGQAARQRLDSTPGASPGASPGEIRNCKKFLLGPPVGPLSQLGLSSRVIPPTAQVDALRITDRSAPLVGPVDGGSKTDDNEMEVEDEEEKPTSS